MRLLEMIRHFEQDGTSKAAEQLQEFIRIHTRNVLSYRKTSCFLFDTGLEMLSRSNRQKVICYRDHYDRILAGIIQRGIEAGEFCETDARLAARNIASMITRTIIWYSPGGCLSCPIAWARGYTRPETVAPSHMPPFSSCHQFTHPSKQK